MTELLDACRELAKHLFKRDEPKPWWAAKTGSDLDRRMADHHDEREAAIERFRRALAAVENDRPD